MPTPDFVLDLRRRIGTDPLPLVGVTAVVIHEGRVLLGRRSDNGALTPITGIVDPGEEPAVAAAREVSLQVPLVVRLEGTNVELGKKILRESGLPIVSADNLADAAEKIVKAVKEIA